MVLHVHVKWRCTCLPVAVWNLACVLIGLCNQARLCTVWRGQFLSHASFFLSLSLSSSFQYDVAPLHSSVVHCPCPSMVRGQQDKPRLPGNSMEGPVAPPQPAQPRKKKAEDFKFGKILGEGSFSTVCELVYSNAFTLTYTE